MATVNHQQPDRTPIFEYVINSPVADFILGRPFTKSENRFAQMSVEIGLKSALRQLAIDYVELAEKLSHDLVFISTNPLLPSNLIQSKSFLELAIGNPVEEIRQRVLFEEENPTVFADTQFLIYPLIREAMDKRGLDLPIFAPAYMHGVWTDTSLMQTMLLEPDLVHRYFELVTQRALTLIDKYISLRIEMIGVGGDFAGNTGPLISPNAYRRIVKNSRQNVLVNLYYIVDILA